MKLVWKQEEEIFPTSPSLQTDSPIRELLMEIENASSGVEVSKQMRHLFLPTRLK
jgi:hypothetical protein